MSASSVNPFSRPVRAYAEAHWARTDAGYALLLDDRAAMTPGGSALAAPTQALAAAIVSEWREASDRLDLRSMILTRMAVAVIDGGEAGRVSWRETILGFVASDLLCYRAGAPAELASRQRSAWDPLLEWVAASYGVRLATTNGIVRINQDPAAIEAISATLAFKSSWRLCGLARAAELTGSAVLSLALEARAFPAADLLLRSRVDEEFQSERWGVDAEALARAKRVEREFLALEEWFQSLGSEI